MALKAPLSQGYSLIQGLPELIPAPVRSTSVIAANGSFLVRFRVISAYNLMITSLAL
jgi:hypothetical protein